MHHFGAFFKLGLQELSNLWSLNSGLLGKAQLLLVNLQLRSQGGTGFFISVRNSSCLKCWGYFRCGGQHIITLISLVGSTQSFNISFSKYTSFFNFNKFSIIDNSQVRSFQNEDIIRRPDQLQNNAATLSGNFFPFIWSDFNSLTINKNFIFLVLNSVGPGWLQNYFSFMNEQFDFLLAFKLLSKDSKVVMSGAISNKNMITAIKFISISAVVKSFYNTVSNSALWVERTSLDLRNKFNNRLFSSDNRNDFLHIGRQTNAVVFDSSFFSGQDHIEGIKMRKELEVNNHFIVRFSRLKFSNVRQKNSFHSNIQDFEVLFDILRHGSVFNVKFDRVQGGQLSQQLSAVFNLLFSQSQQFTLNMSIFRCFLGDSPEFFFELFNFSSDFSTFSGGD